MRKLFLAAGVAALAIAVPAAAKPDKGGGQGGGGGKPAKVERGGGGGGGGEARAARADRGPQARAARPERVERRGGGREMRLATMRSQGGRDRAENRGNSGQERAQNRARRQERVETRGGRGQARVERRNEQRTIARGRDRNEQRVVARGRDRNEQRVVARGRDRNEQRVVARGRDRNEQRVILNGRDRERLVLRGRDRDVVRFRDFDPDRFERRFASRGLPLGFVNGCPPGLAFREPECVPPGQVKNLIGRRLPAAFGSHVLPLGLRDLYRDTDDHYWRYGDGYLYRVDRDDQLIASVLPLIGAGLGVGMPFPYSSPYYHVPTSFQPFYPDTRDDYYRYANGYVYEIDRDTGLIEDMIPLLDRGYGIGQMLPASYSYYNVPYQYRSWYMDDDDYYYRYAPGAIYQVDRDTQLITAIASLLTGNNTGLALGQPLPAGYGAYNVPYAYRDLYYDTPDSLYRYSNGSIYRVDPTTQLVTALVSLLTGGIGVGQPLPALYNSPSYYVPSAYQSFYPDSADDYYRYNNGYVYEVDRHSGLVEDVIPMYDRGFGVGQMLPASYSYYNVPYPYRNWYSDDDDYYYRYAPGAIYQVDRDSRMITSVASLLAGSNALAVGQPLPVGYSAYNVPYAYRDRYYDTPDSWYRYSNGHIYQVDPTTQLITAMISAIV